LAAVSVKVAEAPIQPGFPYIGGQALIDEYGGILESDPDNVLALENLARLQILLENLQESVDTFERVLRLDPLSPVMMDLANAMKLWRPAEARRLFKRVGDLYPELDWKWGIAQIEFQLGHLHHAILWTEGDYITNTRYETLLFAIGDEAQAFALKEARATRVGGSQGEIIRSDIDLWRRDYAGVIERNGYGDSVPTEDFANWRNWRAALFRLRRFEQILQFYDDPKFGRFDLSEGLEFLHALQEAGTQEQADEERAGLRRILAPYIDQLNSPGALGFDNKNLRRIASEWELLFLASEGKVDEALTQMEAMVDNGWRWLAGFSPVTGSVIQISNILFWFEDNPMLDSIRDEPRFIAALDFVKADNARMLAELRAGLTLEDIMDEE